MKIQSGDFGEYGNPSSPLTTTNPLSDEAKIRAILSTWLDYIRLEDLTNAKVDAVRDFQEINDPESHQQADSSTAPLATAN